MFSFKSLNAVQYTEKVINDAKNYLLSGALPDDIRDVSQAYRFKRKWRGFIVDNSGGLFWGPLEVIPENKIREKLKIMYDDDAVGFGIGRDKFYEKVKERYIGISKEDVMRFLDDQESYQLNKPFLKSRIVKPILSSHRNEHWQMDLMVLKRYSKENDGFKYILAVIDVFSKFVWAVPLKSKKGKIVANAIRDIILLSSQKPTVLQSDNGKEFTAEEMKQMLDRFRVKQIFSHAYSPQSNGMIENWNKYAKNYITHHFSTISNHNWINVLNSMVYNWNTSKHGTTLELPTVMNTTDDITTISEVKARIAKSAEKVLKSQAHLHPLNVGDTVRTSRITTGEGRKDLGKKLQANWSDDSYVIHSISEETNLTKSQYKLKNKEGVVLKQPYYRAELLKINPDTLVRDTVKRTSLSKVLDAKPLITNKGDVEIANQPVDIDAPRKLRPRRAPTVPIIPEIDEPRKLRPRKAVIYK